ncbi:MAG: GNAT family N-acetyltransferase [Thermoplasmatota archaeon]
MRVGVLYNRSDELPAGREAEAASVNEGEIIADRIMSVLSPKHEVIPIRTSLDIGKRVSNGKFDIIFNLCEGYGGDSRGEAWVAAQLEMAGIPFTGSDSMTLALCQNKAKTKQVLISKGIQTPRYQVLHSTSQRLEDGFVWPLIVKPVREDASEGISQASVVKNKLELNRMVDRITDIYDQPALVEEYIDGRELNVAIMGNWPCLEVLPVSEIKFDYPPGEYNIVDYDSKWSPETGAFKGSYGTCPAELTREEFKTVSEASRMAFRVLGCRDYARIDIRLREGIAYILEVNPNPGINVDSGFCRSAGQSGLDYDQMVLRIMALTMKRSGVRDRGPSGPEEIFRSGRLAARYVRPADMDLLLEWFNDRETAKMMDEPYLSYTMDDLYEAFNLRDSNEIDIIFTDIGDGNPVGFVSIYDIDDGAGNAEISYLIGDKSKRGRGLGREILESSVRYAFEDQKMNRLEATVLPDNKHSRGLLLSAGFTEVGILHSRFFDGVQLKDEVLYERLR